MVMGPAPIGIARDPAAAPRTVEASPPPSSHHRDERRFYAEISRD